MLTLIFACRRGVKETCRRGLNLGCVADRITNITHKWKHNNESMTVVKLKILFYYPVSGFVLQSASRCESRANCHDTSMHWRMIRIDTDFRFKNTDSPHEIVACLRRVDKMDGGKEAI